MKKTSDDYPAATLALKDYLKALMRHKKMALPVMLLPGIGSTLIFYVPPLIIAAMIRDFGDQLPSTLSEIAPYIGLLAVLWLVGELCWHFMFLILARLESKVAGELYINALKELAQKDQAFFNDNFAGSLTKKALTYGRNFESFLDTITFSVVSQGMSLIFALVILWLLSPILAVLLIGFILTAAAIIIPFVRRRQKLVREREKQSNHMSGYVADVIGNISAVHAFGHEDFEEKQHRTNVHNYTSALLRSWLYDTKNIHRSALSINVLTNVVGLSVALLVGKDAATTATIFIVFNYFAHATRIMFDFNSIYRQLESAITGAAEFTTLRQFTPAIYNAPGAKKLDVTRGEVVFNNVHFTYPETPDRKLFDNLNLTIPAGQKIAFVGRSGGGKTTITKLLLRFIDINDGELLIDGQNIATHTIASLRHSIAYVPQDPAMFHRSITDNIRYGRLDATDEEIREAAHKAHALEFIEKLPEGFDTLVGERGVKLSGGQRQRIAIARAILKDAPILVLDEATSALDSESEKYIQDALSKLMHNRTSIVIAHRLSTIAKLDRIIVLDNGEVIEDGSHDELLKQNGTYAKLWAHQSGGFIEE